ncbi:TPA: hypothetical protein ACH3X2_012419 [Trebouxia sp. C0005]
MVAGSPAKEVGKVTGNPALKMQHWMKNQLVKESYAEKWEDIVRSGNTHSPPQNTESEARLPAEFGTKDQVPAEGTAPMGLSDYADGSQWTQRDGELERRESCQAPDPNPDSNQDSSLDSSAKTAGAQDGGFVGGDGASLNGAARPNNSSAGSQAPSSGDTTAEQTHVSSQQQRDVQGHLQNKPHGSGQLPNQAPTQSSSKNNGAAPPADAGRLSSGSNGASSSGSNSSMAPSDSDWWTEIMEASKRSDCKDTASALSPKQHQPKPSSRQVDGSPARAEAEQDIFGGKAHDPDSQSNSSRQNGASSSPHTSSSSDSSSSKGMSMQTPQASANSSTAAPQSPQEAVEMQKKTQEVRELADKIEGQEAGKGQQAHMPSKGKQAPKQQPEASDFEYWI